MSKQSREVRSGDVIVFVLSSKMQVRLAPSSLGQNMDPWGDESFFVPKPGCHSVSARLAAASPAGRTRDRFPRRDEP
jgi:hypothetical protein